MILLCLLTNPLRSSMHPRDIQLSTPDPKILHSYQFCDCLLCDIYKERRSVETRLSFVINRVVDI